MANASISGTRLIGSTPADQSWTNNTMIDITGLTFAIAANAKVRIRGHLEIHPLGTTGDFQFGFNGPASPTYMKVSIIAIEVGAPPTLNAASSHAAAQYGTGVTCGFNTASASNHIYFEGVFENGSNAGTFACQGAQVTTDASATKVLRGAHIEVDYLP